MFYLVADIFMTLYFLIFTMASAAYIYAGLTFKGDSHDRRGQNKRYNLGQ